MKYSRTLLSQVTIYCKSLVLTHQDFPIIRWQRFHKHLMHWWNLVAWSQETLRGKISHYIWFRWDTGQRPNCCSLWSHTCSPSFRPSFSPNCRHSSTLWLSRLEEVLLWVQLRKTGDPWPQDNSKAWFWTKTHIDIAHLDYPSISFYNIICMQVFLHRLK